MIANHAELFLANHPTSLWEGVLAKWFEENGQSSWRQGQPTVVITPSRSHAVYLKSRLLEKGKGFAGVSFWTPREARLFLLQQFPNPPPIIYRENLRLLLSIAADQFPQSPVAQAVAKDSGGLADVLDLLAGAGWNVEKWGMESAECEVESVECGMEKRDLEKIFSEDLIQIIGAFYEILAGTKLQTVQQTDRGLESFFATRATPEALARREVSMDKASVSSLFRTPRSTLHIFPLASLLITGFDGTHWHLWPLLRTLLLASRKATLTLMAPPSSAEKLDQVWIGSWEEFLGAAQTVSDPEKGLSQPFSHFSNPGLEAGPVSGSKKTKILFRIGKNIRSQSEAVVAQALFFLSEKSCSRIGILLPGYGALSREVSDLLCRLKIPHYDALAHAGPVPPGLDAGKSWLAFQKNPGIKTFLAFLEACPRAADRFPFPPAKIREILKKASTEMLVENPRVLAAFLSKSSEEEMRVVGRLLPFFEWLPDRAALGEFGKMTRAQAEAFGLEMDFRILEELAPLLATSFSRNIFLRWLEENSGDLEKLRDPMGNHPYARVQLLPYSQADQQTWSHLILAGLNEKEWPPPIEESGFLSEGQITRLNQRALKTGSQGEGHWIVQEGMGLCVGPAEKRAVTRAKFFALLESVQEGLCLAASFSSEVNPGLRQVPGDYLSHLYLMDRGMPLDEKEMERLQAETEEWTVSSEIIKNVTEEPAHLPIAIEQTRQAYEARRDPLAPFGEYEFALKEAPSKPMTMACKAWEQALESPAQAWMKAALGVEAAENARNEDPFGLITGSWVHRWISKGILGQVRSAERGVGSAPTRQAQDKERGLSAIALTKTEALKAGTKIQGMRPFVEFPDAKSFLESVKGAAEETRGWAGKIFEEADHPMPDWWLGVWKKARWIAQNLAEATGEIRGYPWAGVEMKIPEGAGFDGARGSRLELFGQTDLLLMENKGAFDQGRSWVIDFKTGGGKPLSISHLKKGKGLQAALYALAFHSLGAAQISASLIRPEEPVAPQVEIGAILELRPLWEELARMQQTGIFGMRGELRPEFGFRAEYPLATLEIAHEILEQKWELTHPGLARRENEG